MILGHAYGNFVARAVATNHPEKAAAVVLAATSTQAPPPEINDSPFRAGDPTRPDHERLAALKLAFFAPGLDASIWVTGQWNDLRAQLGPRVTTKLVHDAGHALFPEQPAAVAAIVVEYLRDRPSAG